MYQRILIPTDGSECSARAVETGVALAKSLDSEVIFLHVIEFPYLPTASPEWSQRHHDLQDQLTEFAEQALASAQNVAQAEGVKSRTVTETFSRAQDVILSMADQYDLIVMGTHGQTGWRRVILGSVTERVLHQSEKPVMVISCRADSDD